MIMLDIIERQSKETDFITDKGGLHAYVEGFYEKEFSRFKDESITLIEIGVNHGGSMRLWNEYFTNAEIYGLDICKTDVADFLEYYPKYSNLHYMITNAYDYEVSKTLPEYDIFIDDGPHTIQTQILSLDLYLNKMKHNGVFVIEDVQQYHELVMLKNHVNDNYPEFSCELYDLREMKGRYDDMIFVARRQNA